jgi:hypothetical protein
MNNITKVAEEMQRVLGEKADEIGRKSGFIKREVKLSGASFVQTLVFGWMSKPEATYEELAQAASTIGLEITAQALEQRFNEKAAEFLEQVLGEVIKEVVTSEEGVIPILERFNGVYIKDSSTITLPNELKNIWEGCGGSSEKGTASAVKIQVELDLKKGTLVGPYLAEGKDPDVTSVLNKMKMPEGSLQIGDLGYWSIEVFKKIEKNQGYFLSKYKTFTAAFDKEGRRWEVIELLEAQKSSKVDMTIEIGVEDRFQCRLLAVGVPEDVAAQRRSKWKAEAKREGKTLSKQKLASADWTIFITNVPESLLKLDEALILGVLSRKPRNVRTPF